MTIIAVSNSGKVTRAEAVYRMQLHRTPDIDRDWEKTRTTLLAPAALYIPLGLITGAVIWHRYKPGTKTSAKTRATV